MATSGSVIEELVIDDQDPHAVTNWIERLEQMVNIAIFNAGTNLPPDDDNNRAARTRQINEIRRSYLLSSLGRTAYKLLKSYCTPDAPTVKTYEELVAILRQKLAPPTNTITEQYRFSTMKQELNESLAVYMGRVKEGQQTVSLEINLQ